MGNVNTLPGVSQVKSLVQLVAGDKEGALATQEQFVHECPVFSQVVSLGYWLKGDNKNAKETQIRCLKNLSNFADGIPVIGHIKGVIHHIAGDHEGGSKALAAATRTTAVMLAGATGFVIGGPAGAFAGGVGAGGGFDAAVTLVSSLREEKYKPEGIFATAQEAIDNPSVGAFFDLIASPVFDGLAGCEGGKIAENVIAKTGPVGPEAVAKAAAVPVQAKPAIVITEQFQRPKMIEPGGRGPIPNPFKEAPNVYGPEAVAKAAEVPVQAKPVINLRQRFHPNNIFQAMAIAEQFQQTLGTICGLERDVVMALDENPVLIGERGPTSAFGPKVKIAPKINGPKAFDRAAEVCIQVEPETLIAEPFQQTPGTTSGRYLKRSDVVMVLDEKPVLTKTGRSGPPPPFDPKLTEAPKVYGPEVVAKVAEVPVQAEPVMVIAEPFQQTPGTTSGQYLKRNDVSMALAKAGGRVPPPEFDPELKKGTHLYDFYQELYRVIIAYKLFDKTENIYLNALEEEVRQKLKGVEVRQKPKGVGKRKNPKGVGVPVKRSQPIFGKFLINDGRITNFEKQMVSSIYPKDVADEFDEKNPLKGYQVRLFSN
ncbi:hypothetical protein B9Z55_003568 [Caenorhabditis nigoni]|uniref:Uncharacterized protein n=1 Tax=Caenorhabditis nigoni TaxID=1611254 RepID=A0A2G5VR22_9PELO|nr:hypothetical protein B9Z55_003568 [Caenorhabditis nigoni]